MNTESEQLINEENKSNKQPKIYSSEDQKLIYMLRLLKN